VAWFGRWSSAGRRRWPRRQVRDGAWRELFLYNTNPPLPPTACFVRCPHRTLRPPGSPPGQLPGTWRSPAPTTPTRSPPRNCCGQGQVLDPVATHPIPALRGRPAHQRLPSRTVLPGHPPRRPLPLHQDLTWASLDSTLESQPWRRPPVYAVALFVPRNEIPLDCNVTPRAYQAARRRPRSARHDGNDYLVVNPSRSACLRWR